MLFRVGFLFAVALLSAPFARAHDAWIEAERNERASGAFEVRFFIGHAETSEQWMVSPENVSSFFTIGPGGRRNHLNIISEQTALPVKRILAGDARLIGLDTFRTLISLDAKVFDQYVAEEGVTPIQRHRAANDAMGNGREIYSRHFKAIVAPQRSESKTARSSVKRDAVTQPIGQYLEIVPERDPNAHSVCEPLPLVVLHKGRSVPGATIHINAASDDGRPIKIVSDAEGRAILERRPAGRWYAHVAWSDVAREGVEHADYVTAFASLSVDASDMPDPGACGRAE